MKKILTLLAILMVAMTSWAENMTQPSGSGTSSDPYLISKATEFEWFANEVNVNGNTSIQGKLMDDIDLGTSQTMIGTSDHKFAGTFDGNGYTVTVAYSSTEDYTALFRYVDGATISHLSTSGTITSSNAFSAGIASYCANSTINCCSSNISITCSINGYGDNGGIVALVPDTGNSSVTVSNCLFNGTFSGENATTSGGIIGWVRSTTTVSGCLSMINGTFSSTCACTIAYAYGENRGTSNDYLTISNCYYTTAYGTTQGTATTTKKLASGEACYGLTGGVTDGTQGWYQNLNNGQTADATPVFDSTHGTVYGGGYACPSTLAYGNKTHSAAENGIVKCSNEGCSYTYYQPATFDSENNCYLIANLGNFIWFANQVNDKNTDNSGYCAMLTADIDLGDNQTMIGLNNACNAYHGTFDGNGHTITVHYYAVGGEEDDDNSIALFQYTEDATIKNLHVAGTITTDGYEAAGILSYNTGYTKIINCISSVKITSTYEDDEVAFGGILAVDDWEATITNVLFDGSLVGEEDILCGGIVGGSDGETHLDGCWFCPKEVTVSTEDAHTIVNGDVTINNCYYTTALGTKQGTATTTETLTSGEVCYGLNGGKIDGTQGWYQTIGTDATPVLDSTHGTVYGGEDACPSTLAYSNQTHIYGDATTDANGICTSYCNTDGCLSSNTTYQEPSYDEEVGCYLITNQGNLIWFANQVNGGTNTINAKLTADVNLGDNQTMIGTVDNKYAGTFDGDMHKVTVNYNTTETWTALFRYTNGATIKNLFTSGDITTTKDDAAGVAGYCDNTTFSHVASDVTINSSYSGDAAHAGIVVGIYNGGSLTACAFTGKILAPNSTNCAQLVGWFRSGSLTLTSCYANPSELTYGATGSKALVRSASSVTPTITNCCYVTELGDAQGTKVTADEVANGGLCYALNGGVIDGTQLWYQNLNNGQTADAQPTWDSTHGTVLSGEDACPSTATYSNLTHTFNDMSGLTLTCANEDCSYSHTAPFRLTAQEDGNVKFVLTGSISATLEYTKNLTDAWTAYTYDTDIALKNGESVYFRALGTDGKNKWLCKDYEDYISLASTCNVAASGNIRSLISTTATAEEQLPDNAFRYFFKDCTKLTQAPVLSGTLSEYCYYGMFQGCTSLTQAPALPAVELYDEFKRGSADYCYAHMFEGCTALQTPPALPATLLSMGCYDSMFKDCTALKTAPVLSETDVDVECYYGMFEGCTALTQAPELPVSDEMDVRCYAYMFKGCTGLTSIPSLPSTRLREECYDHMFYGCTNLKINTLGLGTEWSIPTDATKISNADNWNRDMFTGTAGDFTDAPEIGTAYYVLDKPYTREMTNQWGTLVLPFDIDYDADNTNYNLYYLSAADDKNLTFSEYADGTTIKAGTPMAVKKLSGDAIEIEPASNSTFSTTITPTTAVGGLSMKGTYTEVTNKTGVYFISQDQFWYAESPITIAPFRAWFETPAPDAKSFTIIESDETDGIDLTPALSQGEGVRKYLEGGKVVIVKNGQKYTTSGQRVF